MGHGNGVFGPHIDIALAGADGIGGDEHPFEDRMGIAFQNGPVHERPGIPFVGIADDVLHVSLGACGQTSIWSPWGILPRPALSDRNGATSSMTSSGLMEERTLAMAK